MRSLDGNIDTARAISVATASPQFQIALVVTIHFQSIYTLFSTSVNSKCVPNIALERVNVVFRYHDAGASTRNIIVTSTQP